MSVVSPQPSGRWRLVAGVEPRPAQSHRPESEIKKRSNSVAERNYDWSDNCRTILITSGGAGRVKTDWSVDLLTCDTVGSLPPLELLTY